jgi:uncharacterized protein (DUF924 family)
MTMKVATPKQIIDFWVKDVGPAGWYEANPKVDQQIIGRFMPTYDACVDGQLDDWRDTAQGSLALLLLLDQFSRNMFRGSDKSFANDPLAREIARNAIGRDQDLKIKGGEQQFFYLPFAHSEDLNDQDFGITCIRTRKHTNDDDALHARAHREIIREFGRFPFRNQVLGRQNTDAEQVFMDDGGYGTIVRKLQSS